MASDAIVECESLARLESIIADGIQAFFAVGEALCIIRDKRLYRPQYATFTEYCNARWAFSSSRARQLITGYAVYDGLVISGAPVLPSNEAQARALASVDDDLHAPIMSIAHEVATIANVPMSATLIRQTIETLHEVGLTGAIQIGEEQAPISSLVAGMVADEVIESRARQKAHIANNATPIQKWRGVVVGVSVQDGKRIISVLVDENELDEALVGNVAGVWVKA